MKSMNNQVKSKERVADFGEVNTSEREVNAMLDLVKQETERLDSRFLEPACGDGNFLIEVLNRKLEILVKKYKKNQYEFEKNSMCSYWFNIWSRYS
jgi:23S rRNA G2445 N2-methylase RlmL